MKSLAAITLGLSLLIPPVTAARAQVQIGTGANGGLCFGPYCGPGAPSNVGVGATGGLCFGPNCGPLDNPNRVFVYRPAEPPRSSYESSLAAPSYPGSGDLNDVYRPAESPRSPYESSLTPPSYPGSGDLNDVYRPAEPPRSPPSYHGSGDLNDDNQ